ncbi:MAG: FtsB family cell division protein [Actinomycetota bacterium]
MRRGTPVGPRSPGSLGAELMVAGRRTAASGASTPRASSSSRPIPVPTGGRPPRVARLVVFGGVMLVLSILLAPTLRSYLAQRQEISDLKRQISTSKSDIAALEREQRAWKDPDYVTAQARERLKFVMPGERAYTVLPPVSETPNKSSTTVERSARSARAEQPWFNDMWRSAQIAGKAPAP